MANGPTLLVAAAGTGGHILPGICIGREFEATVPGSRVVYLCGSKEIEREIYRREGITPVTFPSNYGSGGRLKKITGLASDCVRSISLIRKIRPSAVLAMGGAICAPVIGAAWIHRVPYFLHESNAIPGTVVRKFHPRACRVFLGLGGLEGSNVVLTGTPVKHGESQVGERRTVLCVGGSQGARRLNGIFVDAVNSLPGDVADQWDFLLVSGPSNTVENPGRVRVEPYITNLPEVLSGSAFAVTRAGAGTLADLAAFRVPSLLVPYPHAKDNHQEANARLFEAGNAAMLYRESDLTAERLATTLGDVLTDTGRREQMGERAGDFATPDSASVIVAAMVGCLEHGMVKPDHSTAKGGFPHGRAT
ncbi:MAG: UDP-N-acetylglucosamine--N-acetylmuramyl-(pentapeptide) pyrophosphoryl-undecaprenol N-acetylglucosamine transferase [Candidatus Sumerlaeia bacterium]|nr:UDP-N-acetylglucosamine--N-acetylmuramyl-(pentapeptide) pyrophosphoryl-undecaprenol N-acetylglucosamine transferase [Candidatus Sumerlaeia bacterium]